MTSYDFEPACRRMEWLDPFYKAVWEKAFSDAIPISGTFELTPRCNFNCKMCYVHLDADKIHEHGSELSAAEWINIAEQAKQAQTTWLCLTGGEPLMHPEFPKIYSELAQMGFFITLQTNASMLDGEIMELLREYPPRGIKITLYGSTNEIYERVCGVKNGFTRADRGIKALKKAGIPISLVSTVIQQNESDLKNMALYAFKNQLPWTPTKSVKPSVRGGVESLDGIKIETDNWDEKVKYYEEMLKTRPVDINRKPCTYCRDYRLGYWISWEGDMRFCSFMDRPNIPVRELGFGESWKRLTEYEDSLMWPAECYKCKANKICFKCAGSLNAACGNLSEVTECFCEEYKKIYERIEEK